MSISQNFPDISPSLNLNFANSRKLDSRITFTRGSTATFMDENGLVKTAGINQPRFDHSYTGSDVTSLGLLIEESRTNLALQSNTFNTTWTSVGATCVFSQNVVSPTGVSNSGWTIDDQSTGIDAAAFEQQISITPSTTTNYCLSIFAKQGTATSFDFYAFFTGNSARGSALRYNFLTNTVSVFAADGGGITPTIYGKIDYPNGWVRLYFVVNDANNGLNNGLQYRIYPATRDTGLTGTTLFYGAQAEIGAFPTSYIPTAASTVTRSADNASITGVNFSNWYNPSEWTLVTNNLVPSVNLIASPAEKQSVSIGDGTTSNYYTIRYVSDTSIPYIDGYGNASGVPTFDFGGSNFTTFPNPVKSALAVKTNDAAFSYNGNAVQTDNSVVLSTAVNRLNIGSNPAAGTISQLLYYPKRLTNTQLQELTK